MTIVKIEQKVLDYSPEDPSRALFMCSSPEAAIRLRDALVEAGFATEWKRDCEVMAFQGDGTI